MKVLLDSCVWSGARQALEAAGHQVEWVGQWERDPGDEEVLAHACRESQVLITLDRDFGELAVVHRQPHRGIIRLVDLFPTDQGMLAANAIERYSAELAAGAIITIEPGRLRMRPAEADDGSDA